MRYFKALLLLGAIAECAPSPQAAGGSGTGWPLVATKEVKPKYRPNAKRTILSYGPITLYGKDERKPFGSGMSMDPKGQSGAGTIGKGLCNNCTLLSGRFLLRYLDGSPASPDNGVYIHHMLSFDTSKSARSPIGGGGLGGALPIAAFIDRGEDSGDTDTIFTTPDGKYNSGFHLTKPRLTVSYDIINYQNTKKNIYLDVEVEYIDGIQGKDAGHTLKSVAGSPKLNNNGPAVTESGKMSVSADSTIIWARGHLHAGGDKMVLVINGKDICTSSPTYNSAGVITTMSLCPNAIPLKKGDTVTIRSVYDLKKHSLRQSTDGAGTAHGALGGSDVMGMFAISYALGS